VYPFLSDHQIRKQKTLIAVQKYAAMNAFAHLQAV